MKLPLLAALLLTPGAQALTLPTHFASSMVLQRDAPIALWGLDAPLANITVTYRGARLPPVAADATGRFSVTLPATALNATPDTVLLTSSQGPTLALTDTLVGDVYVCSGQSNMAIPVAWSLYYNETLAAAAGLGDRLRILTAANLAEYVNATSPADNFTASLPWSRASAATAAGFSALCYNFGAEALAANPDLPIGLLANPWGGVPIEVYMSPQALAACPAAAPPARAGGAQLALEALAAAYRAALRGGASPVKPSCLYNAMMHPLLSIPVTALLWYRACLQGEKMAALIDPPTHRTPLPPPSPPTHTRRGRGQRRRPAGLPLQAARHGE